MPDSQQLHVPVRQEDDSLWATVDEFLGVFGTGDDLRVRRPTCRHLARRRPRHVPAVSPAAVAPRRRKIARSGVLACFLRTNRSSVVRPGDGRCLSRGQRSTLVLGAPARLKQAGTRPAPAIPTRRERVGGQPAPQPAPPHRSTGTSIPGLELDLSECA
jgi:hypothetical protein